MPSDLKPSGRRGSKLAGGEEGKEEDDGEHLPGGLVFADFFGREDNIFGVGEETESRDEKFAGDDDNDDPRGDGTERDEEDEGCGGENFIGEGIHEFAEVGDEVLTTSDDTIKVVGESSEKEDEESQ